ncbi:choice-of-anchor P family protein [Actinomadura sp. 9N407]|uniref:choice-of-anchor P family protein n=1 Tax=Actinomadura sp. 9N407 TaxID=3375154 RepID=UPI00379A6F46
MRLKHLTKAAAVAGAVAMPLALAVPSAGAATPAPAGSAFALSATGPVAIPATPSVTSAAVKPERKSVAELPANPVVKASVLNAAAWAGHARASVADLAIPRAQLRASAVAARCDQGNGGSHLVKLTVNGRMIKAAAKPNSGVTVQLDGLGTVSLVLNKQSRTPDGRLTVTAIELSLPLGAGKTETIRIASATCGRAPGKPSEPSKPGNPKPSPSAPTTAPPTQVAPAPTPVTGDLPVTG